MQPNAVTAECNARRQEPATVSIAALHLCLSYEQTGSYRIASALPTIRELSRRGSDGNPYHTHF
jgi:hypothetical protein